MTLVNVETGEVVSYADVRRSVDAAKSRLEEAAEQIVWQIEHQAWAVLGYTDWNEMREAEYGGAAFIVPREDRPELMTRMRRSGLTHQQIADTAGVSQTTVRNLIRNSADEQPETVTNARGQQRPASYSKTPDPAAVREAVEKYPDLAYYADAGRDVDVLRTATSLDTYTGPELAMRLDNLRKFIAAEARGALKALSTPRDTRAEDVFVAFNSAALALEKAGDVAGFTEALGKALPAQLDLWHESFASYADTARALAEATKPTLRRVK